MKKFYAVLLVLLLALVPLTAVFAQGETPPPPTSAFSLDALLNLLVAFATLPGVGLLVTSVVNTAKSFGWVKDGKAGRWVAGLNLAFLGLLVYFRFFQPSVAVEYVDAQFATVSQVLIFFSGYLIELVSSKTAHEKLSDAKVPVVGFSYSANKEGAK